MTETAGEPEEQSLPHLNNKKGWSSDLLWTLVGLGLLIGSAFIKFDVPGTSIPISGQSLAVFLVAWFLGCPRGPVCVLIYLLLGFAGAPVFAGGEGGLEKLTGGKGGFLIGFLVCATLISCLKYKWSSVNTTTRAAVIFAVATVLLLVIGNARLAQLYGFEKALEYGFWPFWPGAIIKWLIAISVVYAMKRVSG